MVFNAHFEEHLEPRQNAHLHWKNCFYHVENLKKFIFTFICISHSIHFWNKRKSPPLIWIFVHFGCYTLWIVVLAKILERPLTSKEIKPVIPKGNQSWIFIGRTDAKNEPLILLLPDAKNKPIGKNPDARKDWGQEEKGVTEDEMVGWHHRLNRLDFEQTSENNEGQAGNPSVLQFMGLQKVGHYLAIKQQEQLYKYIRHWVWNVSSTIFFMIKVWYDSYICFIHKEALTAVYHLLM